MMKSLAIIKSITHLRYKLNAQSFAKRITGFDVNLTKQNWTKSTIKELNTHLSSVIHTIGSSKQNKNNSSNNNMPLYRSLCHSKCLCESGVCTGAQKMLNLIMFSFWKYQTHFKCTIGIRVWLNHNTELASNLICTNWMGNGCLSKATQNTWPRNLTVINVLWTRNQGWSGKCGTCYTRTLVHFIWS